VVQGARRDLLHELAVDGSASASKPSTFQSLQVLRWVCCISQYVQRSSSASSTPQYLSNP
jgi:hypothetical protein